MILKRLSFVFALVVLVGLALPCFADTITYEYDDLYRLTKATYSDGTVIEYTYDAAGNRLSTIKTPPASAPTVQIAADPASIQYGASSTLTWTSTNATSCTIDQGVGSVSPNGTAIVSPTATITYTITATGAGGTASANVTVTVLPVSELLVQVETSKGRRLAGVKVYAFTGSGSYTGKSATTDGNGTGQFMRQALADGAYKFRVDYLGYQFWSEVVTIPAVSSVNVVINEEQVEVTVAAASGPVQGVPVYLFTEAGSYLSLHQNTDASGKVSFDLPIGKNYKFRADVAGNQYWSAVVAVTGNGVNQVTVNAGGGRFQVTVQKAPGEPMAGIKVYLFNASGSYLSLSQVTDAGGIVSFEVAGGSYKVRADYLGYQFWSEQAQVIGDTAIVLTIPHQAVEVTVATASGPVQGVPVYLFTEAGSYLSLHQNTDASGKVSFDLPVGKSFKFRADVAGNQYWSAVVAVTGNGVNQVTVNAGGGRFQVTVQKSPGEPMAGVKVYLFNASGSYLSLSQVTDADGIVSFEVAGGSYKVRADYLGYQFWSEQAQVIGDTAIVLTIPHQQVEVTVRGVFQGAAEPFAGITIYLFTAAGSYLGQSLQTNANGTVTFALPEKPYKVRADYLGRQYWSQEFVWQNTAVSIPMADAEITVTGGGLPRQGVKVYVFSTSGSYLGLNQATNAAGTVSFRLPATSYKFRVDYQGSQYWSAEAMLTADQVNPIIVSVGE